ncbi:MAG: tetratricopeptide repeat protein [Myxococcota bacterium]
MARKKHVMSKEELRKPDFITRFFINIWEFVKKYWKVLAIGGGIIAIIAVSISVYIYLKHMKDEKASRAYAKGINTLLRPVRDPSKNEEEKPKKIEKGQRKPVKSSLQLYKKSFEAFSKAVDKCSFSKVCNLIYLLRGKTSLKLANLEKEKSDTYLQAAIGDFQVASNNVKGFVKALAYENLGIAYEELEKFDQAKTAFHKFGTSYNDIYFGQSMLHKARILELQGKTEKAINMYKQVVKEKSTGRMAAKETELQSMISQMQSLSQSPEFKKNPKLIQSLQRNLYRYQSQLKALKSSASITDPGHYAKKRLLFLELGLDYKSQANVAEIDSENKPSIPASKDENK